MESEGGLSWSVGWICLTIQLKYKPKWQSSIWGFIANCTWHRATSWTFVFLSFLSSVLRTIVVLILLDYPQSIPLWLLYLSFHTVYLGGWEFSLQTARFKYKNNIVLPMKSSIQVSDKKCAKNIVIKNYQYSQYYIETVIVSRLKNSNYN